jgi:hypothetical protein
MIDAKQDGIVCQLTFQSNKVGQRTMLRLLERANLPGPKVNKHLGGSFLAKDGVHALTNLSSGPFFLMQQAAAHQNLIVHTNRIQASQFALRLPSIPNFYLSEGSGSHIVGDGVEIPGAWSNVGVDKHEQMPLGCRPLKSRTSQAEGVA